MASVNGWMNSSCQDGGMSYDLAVWVGPSPPSAAAADAEYARRMDAMETAFDQAGGPPPATPTIRAFVEAALARFPELDEEFGDECPWASSPLMEEAVGDLIYVPMTFSGAEYAREVLAGIATAQGLVCYDRKSSTFCLLPTSPRPPRSASRPPQPWRHTLGSATRSHR
jgi:hypothetical protein